MGDAACPLSSAARAVMELLPMVIGMLEAVKVFPETAASMPFIETFALLSLIAPVIVMRDVDMAAPSRGVVIATVRGGGVKVKEMTSDALIPDVLTAVAVMVFIPRFKGTF